MEKLLRPERFEGSEGAGAAEWTHWICTFENFIESLPQDPPPNKLKLLINYVSPTAFSHIADCEEYSEAIKTLKRVYVKPKNIIFARHQLATRKQLSSESIDVYVQSLKLLARECEFKAVTAETYATEAIRDSFIAGLASPIIRQRMLEKDSLSLDEAVNLARSLDTAQRNAEEYILPATPPNLTAASTEVTARDHDTCAAASLGRLCFFCGGRRHPRTRCPARDVECRSCGKTGHFAKVCRSNRTVKSGKGTFTSAAGISSGREETAFLRDPSPPPGYGTLGRQPAGGASMVLASATAQRGSTIPVSVNNMTVNALVDSGSSISFVHPEIVRSLDIPVHPSTFNITLAASQVSKTHGHCYIDLKVQNNFYPQFKFSVMPQLCSQVILGQDFMNKHQNVEFALSGSLPKLTVCGLASMTIDPPCLFPNLTPDIRPITTSTRRFVKSDEVFIRDEIQSLLLQGIIEKSQSPWRAQVLVVNDERHKRRMVVDYSRTVNRFTQLDAYPMPRIHDLIHKMAKYKIFSTLDLKSAYYQVPLQENEKCYTAFEADGQLFQFTRIPFGLTNSVAVFQRVIDSIITDNNLEATFAYIDDVIICGKNQEDHDRNLQRFKEVAAKYNLTLNTSKCKYSLTKINYLGYCIENGNLSPDLDRIKPLLDLPVPDDASSLKRALGLFSYYSIWIPNYSQRIQPLLSCKQFPLSSEAVSCFESLKQDISKASVVAFDETIPLQIETDASSVSIAAVLSQNGRPVAFFSRSLNKSERLQPAVEREAAAIVEAIRKWRLYLIGRKFSIVTDQQAVSFMFNTSHSSKIKNSKILRWRLELSEYRYDIKFRPGSENHVCDTLSRVCSATARTESVSLEDIHVSLCHPGVTRLYHFVRMKNLAYSLDDVRRVCSKCSICSELKPKFYRPPPAHLIKALKPFDRISIDFSGPKPSTTKNKYLLVMVDEFSRFPFVFPCSDMSAQTVIACLLKLFSIFGCPSSIHSDRGTQFMSREVSDFLTSYGVVMTHSSPYHPQGNGQCEREIGTIWRSVCLALKSLKLPICNWETVLDRALHSVRSLLCTATNQTPHERLFSFPRKSSNGYSLPSWLSSPGPVLVRRFVRLSKNDPLVDHVELEHATPHYATIRYSDGRQATVSTHDLAPTPREDNPTEVDDKEELPPTDDVTTGPAPLTSPSKITNSAPPQPTENVNSESQPVPLRRSTRIRRAPDRLAYD